ncbi:MULTISPECIES: hypothetical protein [unclassified Pseudoalteromonas]|uniref:hypothetical protein n=1 Tax=unclassified Pseudoalteromonas TaxID=194690 RepID=UPI00048E3047|nr:MULTISPECIES: hypothetical protein [unclassified Pseudoalteromonas]
MTKTQKQLDKRIRQQLTLACEQIKDTVEDFSFLTHSADLNNLPSKFKVSCYFIDDIALEQAKQKNQLDYIEQLICNALASLNIHIKANAISFSKQP